MNKLTKLAGAAAAATLVAISGSAFTASNTFTGDTSNAGSGSNAVSGYDVTAIEYVPNGDDPQKLDAVKFTLSGAAGYVAIRTNDDATATWFKSNDNRLGDNTTAVHSCTVSGTTWTCDTTGASPAETVAAADNLTVVATN